MDSFLLVSLTILVVLAYLGLNLTKCACSGGLEGPTCGGGGEGLVGLGGLVCGAVGGLVHVAGVRVWRLKVISKQSN